MHQMIPSRSLGIRLSAAKTTTTSGKEKSKIPKITSKEINIPSTGDKMIIIAVPKQASPMLSQNLSYSIRCSKDIALKTAIHSFSLSKSSSKKIIAKIEYFLDLFIAKEVSSEKYCNFLNHNPKQQILFLQKNESFYIFYNVISWNYLILSKKNLNIQ